MPKPLILNIAVAGITGRMGQMVAKSVLENTSCRLTLGSVEPNDSWTGQHIHQALNLSKNIDATITDDLSTNLNKFDALIDFTEPQASVKHAQLCAENQKILILGTTGLTNEQQASIQNAAKKTIIVQAPNMSYGVNLCFKLLGIIGELTEHEPVDIEIIETHHRHKKDAPSGTALGMGKAIAKTKKIDLKKSAVYTRQGITGERQADTIGFQAIRAGDVIGDHTVILGFQGERIELTHKASNRDIFSRGAVKAAVWASKQRPQKITGLFSMQDVITK